MKFSVFNASTSSKSRYKLVVPAMQFTAKIVIEDIEENTYCSEHSSSVSESDRNLLTGVVTTK
jgi:hypothetical protein